MVVSHLTIDDGGIDSQQVSVCTDVALSPDAGRWESLCHRTYTQGEETEVLLSAGARRCRCARMQSPSGSVAVASSSLGSTILTGASSAAASGGAPPIHLISQVPRFLLGVENIPF